VRTLRPLASPFALLTLALGALATVGVSAYEGVWLVGGLLLFSPYVGLAFVGPRARPIVAYAALAAVLALSAAFWVAARSDAQGAVSILYLGPLQWLIAASTALNRLRRREAM
jgi:hypothetical protein